MCNALFMGLRGKMGDCGGVGSIKSQSYTGVLMNIKTLLFVALVVTGGMQAMDTGSNDTAGDIAGDTGTLTDWMPTTPSGN